MNVYVELGFRTKAKKKKLTMQQVLNRWLAVPRELTGTRSKTTKLPYLFLLGLTFYLPIYSKFATFSWNSLSVPIVDLPLPQWGNLKPLLETKKRESQKVGFQGQCKITNSKQPTTVKQALSVKRKVAKVKAK